MTCPHCGETAHCHGFRSRQVMTLLGPALVERHYYTCSECGQGNAPLDGMLGLGKRAFTSATEEIACMAGVQDSFHEAAEKCIKRMAGLTLSESTVERLTEEAGQRLADNQAAAEPLAPVEPWKWHFDAENKTIGYISVDATGVGIQGHRGQKAEGRMAYIGMIYNPVPEQRERWSDPLRTQRPESQKRYVAQVQPLEALGQPLRQQGAEVGLMNAERWVAISDGGAGLEDFIQMNFPKVEAVILDFYHASEYVSKWAGSWFGEGTAEAKQWQEASCQKLKGEGGRALLLALETMERTEPEKRPSKIREEVLRYFRNQADRMNYPEYVKKGWQIGSGAIESACKSVIGERLKGSGMRWGTDGANQLSHLRALYCSEPKCWEMFWSQN